MHGHTAVVGVVDRGVPDVLPFCIAHQMPVDRIPRKSQVLAHSLELDALDKHLARAHRHHVPAVERLFRVGRCLDTDIARQHADFATFIHVERDLAEVHEVQLLVERDRIPTDGGNGSPLCLPGIEIRGREDNLVADSPASGVQDFNRVAACFGGLGQLRPGVRPVTVQVQGSAHEHDPAVTAVIRSTRAAHVFVFDVVGEGNGRLACMGPGFGADFQFPVQHDPLGGQFEVSIVCEAEFAIDSQTAQRRRTDVEEHILVLCNGDLVASGWYLPVRPGGRIRPARLSDCRRSGILSLNDSEHAAEQECWKERSKKERAIFFAHDIPPSSKMTRYFGGRPRPQAGGCCSRGSSAYRLTWRLVPAPGPLPGPVPRTSPVETSLTQSDPLPL